MLANCEMNFDFIKHILYDAHLEIYLLYVETSEEQAVRVRLQEQGTGIYM